jgi:hypothetical protein
LHVFSNFHRVVQELAPWAEAPKPPRPELTAPDFPPTLLPAPLRLLLTPPPLLPAPPYRPDDPPPQYQK